MGVTGGFGKEFCPPHLHCVYAMSSHMHSKLSSFFLLHINDMCFLYWLEQLDGFRHSSSAFVLASLVVWVHASFQRCVLFSS